MTAALLCPAAPALAQTPDLQVCANQGFSLLSATPASGPDALGEITYTWYENGTLTIGSAASLSIPAGKATPGFYQYVRKASNAACTELPSNTYTVEVVVPSVTISPASAAAMTATLTAVVSECSGCRYKWSSGQTTESITVKALDPESSASYACTVTSSAGCSATAAPATV
jgi:hypothetical protein